MGVVLPYTNFIIFIVLAIYFFRKPAKAAAEKRREEFLKLMQEAGQAKNLAEAKLRELEQRKQGLDKELQEMRQIAVQAAESEAQRIVNDAKTLGEHLKAEAKRIAEAEVLKARDGLRREIADAVRDAVEGRIRRDLNSESQVDLVRRQLTGLQSVRMEG